MAQFSVEVKPFTNYDGDDPFVTQSRESVYVVFFGLLFSKASKDSFAGSKARDCQSKTDESS